MARFIIVLAPLCVLLVTLVQSRTTHRSEAGVDLLVPRPLIKSNGQGGHNGTAFDDFEGFGSDGTLGMHSISISAGDVMDSIQVVYVLSNKSIVRAPRHGKESENPINITLAPDEFVVKVEGKTSGQLVNQLTITTVGPNYVHKIYGPFGKGGTLSFSFEGQILGFHGRSGDQLDNIGVYSLQSMKRSDQFGESVGTQFDDYYELMYPPIVKIKSINIWTDMMITAFQVEYLLLDGSTLLGEKHGFRYSKNLTTITFDEDENLTSLEGKVEISLQTAKKYIGQLTFKTTRNNRLSHSYGPYGVWGREAFSIPGNILGFHGRSGALIYKIGAYYI